MWNIMVLGYIEAKDMVSARKLFGKVPDRDFMSENTVLNGYAINDDMGVCKKLFQEMPDRNIFSGNALIDRYFQEMPDRNIFSGNALIDMYATGGIIEHAMGVFRLRTIVEIDGWEFDCSNDEGIWHSSNSRSNSVQPGENDADKGHMNDADKGQRMQTPNDADKGQNTQVNDADKGQDTQVNDAGKGQGTFRRQGMLQILQSTHLCFSRLTTLRFPFQSTDDHASRLTYHLQMTFQLFQSTEALFQSTD